MKIYPRHPFDTSARVFITQDCKPDHQGAKDLNFVGMPHGTPVFSMEAGVVVDIRRNRPHCPTSNCPGFANNVVVLGSDDFYTEYAHITPVRYPDWAWFIPKMEIGRSIGVGDLLGFVDNSGYTIGDPSIHIGRYTPGNRENLYLRPSPCDWYIRGVDIQ
ncbi:peptidoglycan DD-metalloendopeptidase family protein [Bacillus cereus]|uniref:M23 family metallopeptidase n=1 Tax=Bacillus thuringiensis TaxID=1428 RepID=UPI000BF56790|nr:M23 family metallopeptidase [Bacillus thuringiensis]PEV36732.1 hypothetical protein CN426_29810 [Bacillus thuringiensis]PGL80357.1 hypothetical protein CN944_11740 [Bacillus thuringiensis]PGT81134.1 hypothetical protein COD17_28450 [Bacillus thuringiensis]PGZ88297.1 hypothetical protein COE61_06705 [Bacillus thuringiensis]